MDNFQAAAHWWAIKLMERPVIDVGDDGLNSKFAMYGPKPVLLTLEAVESFESALCTLLHSPMALDIMTSSFDGGLYILSVEYHPDIVLEAAAKACGIDLVGRLPLKTTMRIQDNSIEVSEGYGAPWTVVWSST